MNTLYPLTFNPIFKERVWGGRSLEQLYAKHLPPGVPVGESWEISDRPGDVSIVANGPLAGRDLHSLLEASPRELLGELKPHKGRFPWLIKILDASEKLSLQVHPPASIAAQLGGEPKTEMWYIARAAPSAELYVGLKRGVTRREFEEKIHSPDVAACFHRIPVKTGDAMFLPSGRVHAIGAGLVIFEIQQNSDTTYRVYDWNRVGLDGKPRELHINQSLQSIDFGDFEPPLVDRTDSSAGRFKVRPIARHELFKVDLFRALSAEKITLSQQRTRVIGAVEKRVSITAAGITVDLLPGGFCLLPACLENTEVSTEIGSSFLLVEPGE